MTDNVKPQNGKDESEPPLEEATDNATPEQGKDEAETLLKEATNHSKPDKGKDEYEPLLEEATGSAKPEQGKYESEPLSEEVADSLTNDELKHRIMNIHSKFVSDVDPVRLSDFLIQEHVISVNQWQGIRDKFHTPQDRCRDLLHHLYSIQNPKAFLVVRQALSAENHYLLEKIDNQELGVQPHTETVQQDTANPEKGKDESGPPSEKVTGRDKMEQPEMDSADHNRELEAEKDRQLKMQKDLETKLQQLQKNYEDLKILWKEENDRLLKMQKEHEVQKRAWKEENDRLLKMQKEHEVQKRAWKEENDRLLKMQKEYEVQKRAWEEEKDLLLKMQEEHEDQKRAWEEAKDGLLKIQEEHEDQKRAWEEEKDGLLKMQEEHENQKRAWEEEKDRLLKMQEEHDDQKRAWEEGKDRLLKMQEEHDDQKRAWEEEKDGLLKVQEEHEDQKRLWEEEKDRFLEMQKEHEDQKRAWEEEKDGLLKMLEEHEDQKRTWEDEKDRFLELQEEHEDQKRAWEADKGLQLNLRLVCHHQGKLDSIETGINVEENSQSTKLHIAQLEIRNLQGQIKLQQLEKDYDDQKRAWEAEKDSLLKLKKELERNLDHGCKSIGPASAYYGFRQQMNEMVKSELAYMLKDEAFSKIQKIIEKPQIKEDEINQFWRLAFPYIIQRIKMWNGYVLTAENIADLVIRKQKQNKYATDAQISAYSPITLQKRRTTETSVFPVSRLDCLTYLINIADCIVAHDILWIMSKFPMAIPLIVQDIHENDKYIVTVPIIQNTVLRWESNPGQIVENYLFASPFRMVAAIRLGSNNIGKSTILNQLMSKQFMFSSKGEAGGRYGRPCTLDGAVEIVWLTQETCSSATWTTTMSEYYKKNTEELAILANLHGSALQYPETLKYLKKYVCSFIVFSMPGFSEQEWDQLKHCLRRKSIVQVLVDPQEIEDEQNCMKTIRTESLSCDDTLHAMRCLLQKSFNFGDTFRAANIEEIDRQHVSLRYAQPLHCNKAEEILTIVRHTGCSIIKQLLSKADIKVHRKWDNNLKRIITLSLDILRLPTKDAKKHLAHLETNLSQISATEFKSKRSEITEPNIKLRRTRAGVNSKDRQMEEDLKKLQKDPKAVIDRFDNMKLGQEHVFRALSQMYENSLEVSNLGDFKTVRDLPNHFADLLINGHAIEILNGDSGKAHMIWIKAICDGVLKKLPKLKVFIISIIGLQSSGKSTLLNALFSCRFAVSVGRCSRGLFMRLIFLDETLRSSHGHDAIILIDTEGLSSPEKMNDPKASQKDRLIPTFAMGISHLTIVNILGEVMTEMTEILQIAIVAMARLRVGGIKPDILMVQHLQERNVSRIDQAKRQFCKAIKKAFELISKNDVEIGSASGECLAELNARIHSGDLFQHFGPFKDGSSVNSPPSEGYHNDVVILLETILKRIKVPDKKSSFERWCNHFESYWACVQRENFALNFKNVKHITDFLYFEKKIAKVKELLDRAIRCHREIVSKNIRETVSSQLAEKKNTRADSMQRQRLLEDIDQQMQLIPHSCASNCKSCRQFNDSHVALLEELSNTEWKEDTMCSLDKYNTRLHEISMKMLTQMYDGSLVRQGCFSDFSAKIATQLKEALLKRPSGIYTQKEQTGIIKNIWKCLQDIAAGMEGGPSLEAKLNQTLYREYSGIFSTVLEDLENEITIDHLANSKAIKSLGNMVPKHNWEIVPDMNSKLSEDQLNNLISTINDLIDTVSENRCVECCKTGMDFEEGMVIDIKAKFPHAINRFESRFCMKLQDSFKISLQMYALQQFKKKMMDLQKLWDSQNKPSEILKQKKQDYITEIETRLKSGFSSAGEGQVVATKLWNAVKKKAIYAGYDEKVQLIKDMSWTTNSEKVRLCYFEELAKEVQVGKKERALQHFQNPKDKIQKWYKLRIDSFDAKDRVMEIYKSVLIAELSRLMQKISNSTTEAEIRQIVQEHIKAGDDQYYSKLDPRDYNFDAFRESIECKLKSFCDADDKEAIAFPLASDNSEIMGRLGCTEHCYWCGALCWGSRDHQLEKDKYPEMEAHHSCHQPSGLKGVAHRHTKKLISTACHNKTDNWRVWFGDHQEDQGMLWSEAKRNHFKDWKFDAHCITKFDELMRWFFQELHQDIAKSKQQVFPADEKDLEENKCKNLKLGDILKVVRSKI